MKKRAKVVACSSLSQSKGSFVECSDIISNLPIHIAHHILSFLAMEDIARLSIVSKWWQVLCISIPFLALDGMQYQGQYFKLTHFKNFIDRLMLQRNRMKIVQFSVCWMSLEWDSDEYRFLTWLHEAVRCNIEVLYLDLCISLPGTFQMPLCVLHCESLRFLTVRLYGGVLKLPSSFGFTKLQSLSLKRVRVLDKLFVEQVSSFCNFLDKLCLDDVSGMNNINIRSSSLKYIEIRSYEHNDLFHLVISGKLLEELIIHWKFTPSGNRSLRIATPHLKWFTWDGFVPENFFLGKMKCLRSFAFNLEQFSSSWRPPYLEIFHIVEGIKDLVIHVQCLKALCKAGMLPIIPLKHLQNLQINFSFFDVMDDDIVPAIALLLKGVASLQGMFITCLNDIETYSRQKADAAVNLEKKGFDTKFWESQELMCIRHLKMIRVDLVGWFFQGKNSYVLLMYFVKHATELEQLDIVCNCEFQYSLWCMIQDIAASTFRTCILRSVSRFNVDVFDKYKMIFFFFPVNKIVELYVAI